MPATGAPKQDPSVSLHSGGVQTPIPDPTTLTTEIIRREFNSLKELIFSRLDAMDKAMDLFSENITRVPTDTDKQIMHLKELHNEKFDSISVQFKERDTRTEQTSRDSKVAVDAALQAAKEAVSEQNKSNALAIGKSETTFTKQIDQIGTLVNTMQKAIDDKIDDIKSRLQGAESRKIGGNEVWGYLIGGIGMLIGAVSAGVAILSFIQRTIK